jgi:hypothetical protein
MVWVCCGRIALTVWIPGPEPIAEIVYVADATALDEYPLAVAIASSVSDDETVIAPVYLVEETVGVVPFVV